MSSTVFLEKPSLERLGDILAELPRDGSAGAGNLSLVTELGQPERIAFLLNRILDDKDALGTIASRSYRHVNHFDKIVLVDSGDPQGYRLTLHLWCPPYRPDELDDELIHDHRFSFWSNILVGTLVSENFTPAPSAGQLRTRFRQYRYVPGKDDVATLANFYEFVGDTELCISSPSVEAQGSSYHLNYERIHRVVLPQRDMVCTLVLRGPRMRNHSNVYNTAYPSQDVKTDNRMFTVAELTEKLTGLRREILRSRA